MLCWTNTARSSWMKIRTWISKMSHRWCEILDWKWKMRLPRVNDNTIEFDEMRDLEMNTDLYRVLMSSTIRLQPSYARTTRCGRAALGISFISLQSDDQLRTELDLHCNNGPSNRGHPFSTMLMRSERGKADIDWGGRRFPEAVGRRDILTNGTKRRVLEDERERERESSDWERPTVSDCRWGRANPDCMYVWGTETCGLNGSRREGDWISLTFREQTEGAIQSLFFSLNQIVRARQ
jgi:hypothetical protein